MTENLHKHYNQLQLVRWLEFQFESVSQIFRRYMQSQLLNQSCIPKHDYHIVQDTQGLVLVRHMGLAHLRHGAHKVRWSKLCNPRKWTRFLF